MYPQVLIRCGLDPYSNGVEPSIRAFGLKVKGLKGYELKVIDPQYRVWDFDGGLLGKSPDSKWWFKERRMPEELDLAWEAFGSDNTGLGL